MNILDDSLRLIDALSGWGLRECVKYPEVQVPSDESHRTILGMEVVLRHVPELIARILLAELLAPTEPRAVFRAEFGLEDVDKLPSTAALRWPITPATSTCSASLRVLT